MTYLRSVDGSADPNLKRIMLREMERSQHEYRDRFFIGFDAFLIEMKPDAGGIRTEQKNGQDPMMFFSALTRYLFD